MFFVFVLCHNEFIFHIFILVIFCTRNAVNNSILNFWCCSTRIVFFIFCKQYWKIQLMTLLFIRLYWKQIEFVGEKTLVDWTSQSKNQRAWWLEMNYFKVADFKVHIYRANYLCYRSFQVIQWILKTGKFVVAHSKLKTWIFWKKFFYHRKVSVVWKFYPSQMQSKTLCEFRSYVFSEFIATSRSVGTIKNILTTR